MVELAEAADSDQPDLIREALSYFKEPSDPESSAAPTAAVVPPPIPISSASARKASQRAESQLLDAHIQDVVEKSLDTAMRSEVSGLSDTLVQTVQRIMKEVAPTVIRQVVQEEIEQIKKSEQG